MSLSYRNYPVGRCQVSATGLAIAALLTAFGCADPTAPSDAETGPLLSSVAATAPSFVQVSA
ncbi:MAG TPA: hypothetical protein VK899_11515, partial [Gemmatimonadales bacterium]|nr:hypothetical protein [Gemmatimonadales bacterium]